MQSAAWVITILRALLEANKTNYKLVPYFFHGLQSLPGAHFSKAAAVTVRAELSSVGVTQRRRWLQNQKAEAGAASDASANTWVSVSSGAHEWMSELSEEYRRAQASSSKLKLKGVADRLFETGTGSSAAICRPAGDRSCQAHQHSSLPRKLCTLTA